MAIYVRGDSTPFVLTGKSDEGGTKLFGYFSDDEKRVPFKTDRSRIVADGAAAEVEAAILTVPVVPTPRAVGL